jgi:hypothetical protein
MSWLDDHPGRPRVTARLYRVIALLDAYSARSNRLVFFPIDHRPPQ